MAWSKLLIHQWGLLHQDKWGALLTQDARDLHVMSRHLCNLINQNGKWANIWCQFLNCHLIRLLNNGMPYLVIAKIKKWFINVFISQWTITGIHLISDYINYHWDVIKFLCSYLSRLFKALNGNCNYDGILIGSSMLLWTMVS